jgi:hypothetical protein
MLSKPRRYAVTIIRAPNDISALFSPLPAVPLNKCRLTCATHRGSQSRAHSGAPATSCTHHTAAHSGAPATSCTHHTAALRAFTLRTFQHAPFSVNSVKRHESFASCNLSPARTYKRTPHDRPTDISAIKLVLIQQHKHVRLPPAQATTAYGWLSANTPPLIQVSG